MPQSKSVQRFTATIDFSYFAEDLPDASKLADLICEELRKQPWAQGQMIIQLVEVEDEPS